jgi:oligopeptide/dipeptide ABC transporter ATP-binding protein
MQKEAPLLKIDGLTVTFDTSEGVVHAVDGVSFEIGKGEIVGLVGESGCGKSVTALSILRLLPVPPASITGKAIRFRDQDLLQVSEDEMRSLRGRSISMVFQDPMTSLNPVFKIGFQIREMIQTHFPDMDKTAVEERAIELLRRVRIPSPESRMTAYPHELSGGLRQRVMIAMALACDPELMIADEPTTALDVTIQAQILELVQELQNDLGMSMLLITHDLGIVAQTTQRIVVMYAGKVVEQADTATIFKTPRHPYTQGLLGSLPGRYVEIEGKRTLPSIPGMVPSLIDLPKGCTFQDRCDRAFERCEQVMPPLFSYGNSQHFVRCWHYAGEEH